MNDKIRVLVIEDEAIIAENLKHSLEDLGFDVVDTCYTYDEAKDAIEHLTFDLALLDINLSDLAVEKTGFQLAMLLKAHYPIPFVFITAYSDVDTIKAAAKLQPYGYLVKPISNATLFATVQIAIERSANKTTAVQIDNNLEKPEYFFVKIGSHNYKIMWADIYCLEAGKNYVKLKATHKAMDYPLRGSLFYVINSLMPTSMSSNFIRVERSTYLNVLHITKYDHQFIYCSGEKFTYSKSTIIALKKLMANTQQT